MLPRSCRPLVRLASRDDPLDHTPVEVRSLSVVAKVCRELVPPGVERAQVCAAPGEREQGRAGAAGVVVGEKVEAIDGGLDQGGGHDSERSPGAPRDPDRSLRRSGRRSRTSRLRGDLLAPLTAAGSLEDKPGIASRLPEEATGDQGAIRCSSCGHESPDGAKFCEECAAPLVRRCGSCGATLRPTAKFCVECATPTAPAVERDPRAYTPKHL